MVLLASPSLTRPKTSISRLESLTGSAPARRIFASMLSTVLILNLLMFEVGCRRQCRSSGTARSSIDIFHITPHFSHAIWHDDYTAGHFRQQPLDTLLYSLRIKR